MVQNSPSRLSFPTASAASTSPVPRVRFAPSPSGYIHIGNLRIALSNWLFALQQGGQFILRYDDTDSERTKNVYVREIYEDLAWFGIVIHAVFYQSRRFFLYDHAVKQLKKKGLLYPCYESKQELSHRRKERLLRKLPPIYGREALRRTAEDRKKFESEGRRPYWRFLLPNFRENVFELIHSPVSWDDLVRGQQSVDLSSVSDPVLVREDGSYLYALPSVVDDSEMGISHIIRGDDHITNTGIQIAIFRALDAKLPDFGHINLLTTKSGNSLSKRKDSLSVRRLRETGVLPGAVASLAILTGTCKNVVPCRTMEELEKYFKLSSFSKSSAKFDPADLSILNKQLLRLLSAKDVLAFIKQQNEWQNQILSSHSTDIKNFDSPRTSKGPAIKELSSSTSSKTKKISPSALKRQHDNFPAITIAIKKTNFVKRWEEKVKTFRCLEAVAQDFSLLSVEQKNIDAFWSTFHNNFESLYDILQWWKIVFDPQMNFCALCKEERPFLHQTIEFLPDEPWNCETWQEWKERLKEKSKRSGKDLFQPLRLALTGKKGGPELANLLPLMGKVLVISRLLCIGERE